jgi:hypothetical protein
LKKFAWHWLWGFRSRVHPDAEGEKKLRDGIYASMLRAIAAKQKWETNWEKAGYFGMRLAKTPTRKTGVWGTPSRGVRLIVTIATLPPIAERKLHADNGGGTGMISAEIGRQR